MLIGFSVHRSHSYLQVFYCLVKLANGKGKVGDVEVEAISLGLAGGALFALLGQLVRRIVT